MLELYFEHASLTIYDKQQVNKNNNIKLIGFFLAAGLKHTIIIVNKTDVTSEIIMASKWVF